MATRRPTSKHELEIPELLKSVRYACERIPDAIKRKVTIPLTDCIMGGLAVFSLKYSSLLQFDQDAREDDMLKNNLNTLYGIKKAPSDTYMRERLDQIDPENCQKIIDKIIRRLEGNGIFEKYKYHKDYCLVSIDGTGYFSSHDVHCDSCCVKNHRDGTITYYHQMLAAVMVHPGQKTVFPLSVEPIRKSDGMKKNDCEHNAAIRLLKNLKNSHPKLKMIVVLDGLYADATIINLLKELKIHFIITAKENDLKYLFDAYQACKASNMVEIHVKDKVSYSIINNLPLNYKNEHIKVNLLESVEKKKGKTKRFVWITDLNLNEETSEKIAKGGRARWKIENETFNTLKNQGYQFEHNFGHGEKNLSTVLAYLMFIAFLIDQVQQFSCQFFNAALTKCIRRSYLWNKIRGLFFLYFIDSWEQAYKAISLGVGARLSEAFDSS